jgi:hypothetical protein
MAGWERHVTIDASTVNRTRIRQQSFRKLAFRYKDTGKHRRDFLDSIRGLTFSLLARHRLRPSFTPKTSAVARMSRNCHLEEKKLGLGTAAQFVGAHDDDLAKLENVRVKFNTHRLTSSFSRVVISSQLGSGLRKTGESDGDYSMASDDHLFCSHLFGYVPPAATRA